MVHGAAPSAMDPGAMDPGAMAPAPLADALDAYLAAHAALAADALAPDAARAFASAFDAWTAAPPADDPHAWHRHAEAVAAVRRSAAALAEARTLDAARAAFGALSAPLVGLLDGADVPDGYDLARFTCGMAPGVPQGGVWVQRAGTPANPFFGSAMPTCARRDGPAEHGAHAHDHGDDAH